MVQLKKPIQESILNICGSHSIPSDDIEAKCLQTIKDRASVDKAVLAACLLRMLPEPALVWIKQAPWRPVLTSFFDFQINDSIYREKRIDINLMGHEKLDRLSSIVEETESKLTDAFGISSIDQYSIQRKKIMAALNCNIGRVIIRPFLIPETDTRLLDAYTIIEEYISRKNDPDVMDVFNQTIGTFDTLGIDFESLGTLYGHWFKKMFCDKFVTLLAWRWKILLPRPK